MGKKEKCCKIETEGGNGNCEEACWERGLPKDVVPGNHRICPLRIMFTVSRP